MWYLGCPKPCIILVTWSILQTLCYRVHFSSESVFFSYLYNLVLTLLFTRFTELSLEKLLAVFSRNGFVKSKLKIVITIRWQQEEFLGFSQTLNMQDEEKRPYNQGPRLYQSKTCQYKTLPKIKWGLILVQQKNG